MPLSEVLFKFRTWISSPVVFVEEFLAVLGIAVGVALLFASQVASQSLDGSVRELTRELVGGTQYQLDARGPSGFPEALALQAQAVRGVQAALPLIDQQATIIGPKGSRSLALLGVDPRFARLGGPLAQKFSGRELSRQRVIALPKPLAAAIGVEAFQDVSLQTAAGEHEALVAATLGASEAGGLLDGQVAIAPVKYAQSLLGTSASISRLYVKIAPGHRASTAVALRRLAEAHGLNFVPADFDAKQFAVASAPAQQGETLFSVISAVVGFLFAFNAMLLTVGERRRWINTMRGQGTDRATIVQVLLLDALMIGGAASILGLCLGELLSIELFHSEPGYLAFAFPVGQQRIVTASTIATAVAAGFVAALIGVLAPIRDLLGPPLREDVELERRARGWTPARIAAGALCLAATTAIVLFRPQSAVLGVITLVIAMLALLPFLFNAIVFAFVSLQRPLGSMSSRLAAAELTDPTTRVRSLAIAATGAIAIFGSVAIAGAKDNLRDGLNATASEWNRAAEIWVSPAGESNTLATSPFPASTVRKLHGLAQVASVSIYRGGFLNVGDRRVWVIAPPRRSTDLIPAGQLTEGNLAVTNHRLRSGGWAVLSEAIAHELHLHIGDSFTLPSPRPTRFRLAGLSTNGGWPPGAIVINSSDYAAAWASSAASALNIAVAPGYSPAAARGAIVAALGPKSGLTVQTAAQRATQWKRISHRGLSRLTQISILVSIAAILAMAGVMTSLIWQRRERIAYLKLNGNRKGEMWLALLFESAVLLGSGCLIGAVFGLYGQLVISHALATVTGFPITISVGLAIAVFSFLIVGATTLAIVTAPGFFVVRVRATLVKPS